MKINSFFYLLILLSLCNCQNAKNSPKEISTQQEFPERFQKILDAHGGLGTWNKMNTLTFHKGEAPNEEIHTTDLKSRKALIEVKGTYRLGNDGKKVWVTPNKDAFPRSSPRFFHNLYFYFVAIPFVLADPGVNYEVLEDISIDSKRYNVLKTTFDDGIGDASGDHYILYTDPQTNKIAFITYSVTYFDSSKATSYKALRYKWAENNGILAPTEMSGYKWENNAFGDFRYSNPVNKLNYSQEKMDDNMFAVPTGAYVE